jgi:hypothetical protein
MRTLFIFISVVSASLAASIPKQVTFHKDVLPVLQKNCQGCHRPGEAAPMSFLTYQSTRPFAKAIKEAVATRRMPPWHADPHYGKFSNDASLSQGDIDLLVAWADSGAKEGNPKDAPKPVKFAEGWNIGKPDLVLEMPKPFTVPAKGTVDYTYYILPVGNKEDVWVERAEVRPGNRAVLHHVIAFVRVPGNKWLEGAKPGEPFLPPVTVDARGRERRANPFGGQWLTVYAPGTPPQILPPGQARLIPAGSDIVLQMHYTANGKEQVDASKVGLIFAKQPPTEQVLTLAAQDSRFEIPANAANHEVKAEMTLYGDVKLSSFFPHMHLRGKDFQYEAVYPSGESEILLRVPRYDFAWQLIYEPKGDKILPKGTKIRAVAHFDNSANNKANPDPTKAVRFGEQSWEEMMIGFFDVAVKPGTTERQLMVPPKKTTGD